MRSERLLAAATALLCLAGTVSCGKTKTSSPEEKPESDSSVNVADETATEKGKIPAYKVTVNLYDSENILDSVTVKEYNRFDDVLLEEVSDESQEYSGEYRYTYEYNADGLILKKETDIESSISCQHSEVLYTYDEHGEELTCTTVLNGETIQENRCENEYDSNGRIAVVKRYTVYHGEEKPTFVDVYSYNINGLISKYEKADASGILSAVETTFYTYDENGNTVRETRETRMDPDSADPDHVWEFNYTYNSHNFPEIQKTLINGELRSIAEFKYEFYE